jgi:hypothetical protein
MNNNKRNLREVFLQFAILLSEHYRFKVTHHFPPFYPPSLFCLSTAKQQVLLPLPRRKTGTDRSSKTRRQTDKTYVHQRTDGSPVLVSLSVFSPTVLQSSIAKESENAIDKRLQTTGHPTRNATHFNMKTRREAGGMMLFPLPSASNNRKIALNCDVRGALALAKVILSSRMKYVEVAKQLQAGFHLLVDCFTVLDKTEKQKQKCVNGVANFKFSFVMIKK